MNLVHSALLPFVLAAAASLSWRGLQQAKAKVHLDRLKAAMGYIVGYGVNVPQSDVSPVKMLHSA